MNKPGSLGVLYKFTSTNEYTIYLHCRKIYNLFLRALETGRKANLWRVQVNFIFVYYVYPAISKSPKQEPRYLNIAETSVVIIILNGVFCEVRGYTVIVAHCGST